MSEKTWITFCNIFVFHQYKIHLFYLKYLNIKNMKVVLYRKRGLILFLSYKMFSNTVPNKLSPKPYF